MQSPSQAKSPPGSSGYAGVAVLGNRALFAAITTFMAGYPLAVSKFLRESDASVLDRPSFLQDDWLTMRNDFATLPQVSSLARDGVLPNLAIAASDPAMLELLYKLRKHHRQYQGDRTLSFSRAMTCAVVLNRVEMLDCIAKLTADDSDWQWEPHLMRIALQRGDPDIRVIDWLYSHYPGTRKPRSERDVLIHTVRGDLDVVRWLHERQSTITDKAVAEAAKNGHTHLLVYFFEHATPECGCIGEEACSLHTNSDCSAEKEAQSKQANGHAFIEAASNGHLEAVRFFIERQVPLEAPNVIDYAAVSGHLDVIKYLHGHCSQDGCTSRAMHDAAAHGHLETVRFLSENRSEGCLPNSLERAARNGHLEVVQFLHEKYALECSEDGVNHAAVYGHLAVLQFLHQHVKAEFAAVTMDHASYYGHLDIVKFLHSNRSEGCTRNALSMAARGGHFDIVVFLLEHRTEGDVRSAFIEAAMHGRLDIVQLLRPRLESGDMVPLVVEAATPRWNFTSPLIWEYLCGSQEPGHAQFLKYAVVVGAASVVNAVWRYASADELTEAERIAVERNESEIAEIIADGIRAMATGQHRSVIISNFIGIC